MALTKLILIGGVALIAWWAIGRPTSIEELREDIDNITNQLKGQSADAQTTSGTSSLDNTNSQGNTADDTSGDSGGGGGGGGDQSQGGDSGGGDSGGGDASSSQDDSGPAPSIGGGGRQSGDTTSIPTASSNPFSSGGSAQDDSSDSGGGGDFPGFSNDSSGFPSVGGASQGAADIGDATDTASSGPSPAAPNTVNPSDRNKKPPHPAAVRAKGGEKHGGGYKGDPGFYTVVGHHHCDQGEAGCKCTDCHKCNCHGPVGTGKKDHVPPHAVLKTQAPATQIKHITSNRHPHIVHKHTASSPHVVGGKHPHVVHPHPSAAHVVGGRHPHTIHPHTDPTHHTTHKKKKTHDSNLAYTLGYDGNFHYLESSPISLLYHRNQ